MAGKNDFPTNPNDSINAYDFGGQLLSSGLTKREYFTAFNMAAMVGSCGISGNADHLKHLAEIATAAADATIEALNKPIS